MPKLTDPNAVIGIDLKIDESIDKICEISNSTSTNIRSVWYIIVIVSSLSFAEFWNSLTPIIFSKPPFRTERSFRSQREANLIIAEQKNYFMTNIPEKNC